MFLLERYFARRFHQTVYLLNQLSSDLDKWESLPDQVYQLVNLFTTLGLRQICPIQRSILDLLTMKSPRRHHNNAQCVIGYSYET